MLLSKDNLCGPLNLWGAIQEMAILGTGKQKTLDYKQIISPVLRKQLIRMSEMLEI